MKHPVHFLVMLALCSTLAWPASGVMTGNGTKASPYLVEDYADLKMVTGYGLDKAYRQVADIDASASLHENKDSGFSPISHNLARFKGSFAGGGHSIRNLVINRPNNWYMGLFGYLDTGSVVDSLHLTGVNIRGYDYVGGIAASSSGSIRHCSVNGTIWASEYVGMLVGQSRGTVDNSWTSGEIHGLTPTFSCMGGLVGAVDSGVVSDSRSSVSIIDATTAGGLVGANKGRIVRCHASGNLTHPGAYGGSNYLGGLVGSNLAVIDSCYATGNIKAGGDYHGGLAGTNNGYASKRFIDHSYSTGTVTGFNKVGGLVGSAGDTIRHCYATGLADALENYAGGLAGSMITGTVKQCYAAGLVRSEWRTTVGGFAGNLYAEPVVNSYYWDRQRSGQLLAASPIYGTGKQMTGLSTDSMKLSVSFAGWSFDDTGEWKIVEGKTYPALRGVDNAPFAFSDSVAAGRSYLLSKLSSLAQDVELATQLVVRAESLSLGSLHDGLVAFPDSSKKGDTLRVKFRVGKVLEVDDTLWGNRAHAMLILDPAIPSDGPTTGIASRLGTTSVLGTLVVKGFSSPLRAPYTLTHPGSTTVLLYDLKGNRMASSDQGFRLAGTYWTEFDVREGIYLVRTEVR